MIECIVWTHFLKKYILIYVYIYRDICCYSIFLKECMKRYWGYVKLLLFCVFLSFSNIPCECVLIFDRSLLLGLKKRKGSDLWPPPLTGLLGGFPQAGSAAGGPIELVGCVEMGYVVLWEGYLTSSGPFLPLKKPPQAEAVVSPLSLCRPPGHMSSLGEASACWTITWAAPLCRHLLYFVLLHRNPGDRWGSVSCPQAEGNRVRKGSHPLLLEHVTLWSLLI